MTALLFMELNLTNLDYMIFFYIKKKNRKIIYDVVNVSS
jgi:hypothetical protein